MDHFGLARLVVLVVASPGHKDVETPAELRLALARAAFPWHEVEFDANPRTVDLLLERRYEDPLFIVGADEFADFLAWKEPERVLEIARLAVATRPGYPRDRLDAVLQQLSRPERVLFFEIESIPLSSSDIRARVERGKPIDALVPAAVASEIARLGLYRGGERRS